MCACMCVCVRVVCVRELKAVSSVCSLLWPQDEQFKAPKLTLKKRAASRRLFLESETGVWFHGCKRLGGHDMGADFQLIYQLWKA